MTSFLATRLLPVFPLCLLLLLNVAAAEPLWVDDFETDLSAWEEEVFNGRNQYELVLDADNNQVLHARSDNSASALIQRIEIDPHEYPLLSWRWKIAATVPSGDARVKAKDDYAARIYIIFPHWIKPLTRTINYIWANRLPAGESIPSPYFQRSVMVAVESGNDKAGRWLAEERNLLEDYRRLFGEEPPQVGGIAIMTDTDDTGEQATAWYDELLLRSAD